MSEANAESSSSGLFLTPKVALVVAFSIPSFFFLLDDLLGLIEGGGIISTWHALQAARQGAPVINVDSAGLRTIFVLLSSIVVIVPSTALRANLANKLVAFAVLIPIIAGGFISDGAFDQSIVEHLVAAHGYRRCKSGDFHKGNGKSRVWFDNYVLSQSNCRSTFRRS